MELTELVTRLDDCLEPQRFRDYCPNGLQVEGRANVNRLATGVTASQALLDAAVAWGADAILVHHGYFWRGESPTVTGMKRRRLGTLIDNDVSLLAYHLPLDAHPEMGNNACLGQLMGISIHRPLQPDDAEGVGSIGDLPAPLSAGELVARLADITDRPPLHIGDPAASVQRIGWCTGAAQSYLEAAARRGLDAFVSGEISEPSVHIAREYGIHYFAAGHHATERYGVQALGEHLARQFEIQHTFIDIDNPV